MTLHVTMNTYQVCKRCCYFNVKNITEVMGELGNPFADASTDLYSLETKQIMSERVVKDVTSAEDMGKIYQYQKCVVNRISSTATVFNDTIHKNNQTLFLRRNQIPSLRFPIFKMISSCSPVCIYLASLGKVTWMPSLLMKIMPGPNPWQRMEQCANQIDWNVWSHSYRIQNPSQKLISELLMLLPLCTCLIHTNPVYLLSGTIPS